MLYKTWAGERNGDGGGLVPWAHGGTKGSVCLWVGRRRKLSLRPGMALRLDGGEGVMLGEGSLRACEGIALPGRKRPSKNGMT